MIIQFEVKEQQITQINKPFLVKDSKNYLKLHFNFNTAWKDLTKQIKFNSDEPIELLEDTITVPSDVTDDETFKFTLKGINTEEDVIITTNTITIKQRDEADK